jgi:uncharacterized membrane protein YfcA
MQTLMKTLIAIFIGSIVGFIGGFQGIAGGFYISMLLMAFGIAKSERSAAGTTLLAILWPVSIGAVYEYWKTGDIEVVTALIIAFFYTIFAWFGSKMNEKVSEKYVVLSLATLMFLTSLYFFYKYHTIASGKDK